MLIYKIHLKMSFSIVFQFAIGSLMDDYLGEYITPQNFVVLVIDLLVRCQEFKKMTCIDFSLSKQVCNYFNLEYGTFLSILCMS